MIHSKFHLNTTTKKPVLEWFYVHCNKKSNVILCSKDTDILFLMVFFYALNKISEKRNILELTFQQSFPKFLKLQGVTQLLFYMLLVKLKCLNGKEKLKLLNAISVSCKVSECWKVYSNCLLTWERRRESYWNQGAVVEKNENKNFSVIITRRKLNVASY